MCLLTEAGLVVTDVVNDTPNSRFPLDWSREMKLGFIAKLMDENGTIAVSKYKSTGRNHLNYYLRLDVRNKLISLCEMVEEVFPTGRKLQIHQTKDGIYYGWNVSSLEAYHILRELRGLIKIKCAQVELGIEYVEKCILNISKISWLTPQMRELRRHFYLKFQELNSKLKKSEVAAEYSDRVNSNSNYLNSPSPFIYLVSDGEYIKIGKSDNHPWRRIVDLQVGNPRSLKLLGYSKFISETDAHDMFFLWYVRGEWFRIDATLLSKLDFSWLDFIDSEILAELKEQYATN